MASKQRSTNITTGLTLEQLMRATRWQAIWLQLLPHPGAPSWGASGMSTLDVAGAFAEYSNIAKRATDDRSRSS